MLLPVSLGTGSRLLTGLIEANGSPLDVVGQITMPVSIGNFTTEQAFAVVNALT